MNILKLLYINTIVFVIRSTELSVVASSVVGPADYAAD